MLGSKIFFSINIENVLSINYIHQFTTKMFLLLKISGNTWTLPQGTALSMIHTVLQFIIYKIILISDLKKSIYILTYCI